MSLALARTFSAQSQESSSGEDSDVVLLHDSRERIYYPWDEGNYDSFRSPAKNIIENCRKRGSTTLVGGYGIVGTYKCLTLVPLGA